MEWDNQRASVTSTPSSLGSQSTVNSIRSDKISTFKQISPSPSVSALSKLTDDDLRRKGVEDLVRIIRRVEGDYKSLLSEHGGVVKEVNRRLQIQVLEGRSLREGSHRLQEENQELRDLCCFLDDDRQRGRKLAREWQRFGRYTASVMRSEVAVYQDKLRELEERQSELVTENMELKELCLYLDGERGEGRDEGDGSSSGTVTGHEEVVAMDTTGNVTPTPALPMTSSSTASYIKELEQKVSSLEEEKKSLAKKMERNPSDTLVGGHEGTTDDRTLDQSLHASVPLSAAAKRSSMSGKPEAVVHAMKVLQVHEELEKSTVEEGDNLDASEKAIVREMCNVVWRKLGDVGDVGSFNDSSDSILDPPPFVPDSPIKPNSSLLSASGQAHSHSVSQPQPQMASTPLAAPTSRAGTIQGNNQANLDPSLPRTDVDLVYSNSRQNDRHLKQYRTSNEVPMRQQQPPPHNHSPRQHPGTHPNQSQPPKPHSGNYHNSRQSDRMQRPDNLAYHQQMMDNEEHRGRKELAEDRVGYREEAKNYDYQSQNQPYWSDGEQRNYPQSEANLKQNLAQYRGHPHIPQNFQGEPLYGYHRDMSGFSHPADRQPNRDDRPQSGGPRELDRPLGPRDRNIPQNAQRQPPAPVLPRAEPHRQSMPSQGPLPNQGDNTYTGSHYPHNVGGHLPNQGDNTYTGSHYPPNTQNRNLPNPGQQPVRLLDAPGVPRYTDGGAQRSTQRKEENQRPRSRGEIRQDDRERSQRYDDRSSTAPQSSVNPSSHSNPPGHSSQSMPVSSSSSHMTHSQAIPGFRAYPPASNQATPAPWRIVGVEDVRRDTAGYQTPRSQPPAQSSRSNYSNPPGQGRSGNPGRVQEQEWRQTYLDDSDTL